MSDWTLKKKKIDIKTLMDDWNISFPLACVLSTRKISDFKEISSFIGAGESGFEDITDFKDIRLCYEILKNAIEEGKKICIYGDYDVDGVMSTVIIYKVLTELGAYVNYFIPDRVKDGYGLNKRAVKDIRDRGYEILLTCDNGIAALEEIDYAKSMGMTTIIFDHHEPHTKDEKQVIPSADVVVDAKAEGCGYSFKYMCAAGLCYRIAEGFYKYLGAEFESKDEMLLFAGIATVCDSVELVGENRTIVKKALEIVNKTEVKNIGLRALINRSALKDINEFHFGFVIGPCINACGRLGNAKTAVELFITSEPIVAEETARELFELNEKRKKITDEGRERIEESILKSDIKNDIVTVVYDDTLHESVAGIIAGRLKEEYNKPTFVLTNAQDCIKGSGRSIENYNMVYELSKCESLLTKYGGHAMAAGLSLKKEDIDKLRLALNKNTTLTPKDIVKKYRAEGLIELKDITVKAAEEIKRMSPFGAKNEKPVFVSKALFTKRISFMGSEKQYFSLVLEDKYSNRIRAVDFKNAQILRTMLKDKGYTDENCEYAQLCLDVLYTLDVDEYREKKSAVLRLIDLRESRYL